MIYLNSRKIAPYLFIAPILILIVYFRVVPIGYSIWLSFMRYNFIRPDASVFVGFDNFTRMATDEFLWRSLRNTVYYVVGTLGIGIILSLILALLICEPWFKFQAAARSIMFVPFIMSMVITGLIWSYIYQPDFGILNVILHRLGLPTQRLLGNPRQAMWAIIIMVVWRDLGFRVTIWSAGILSISQEYLDAARIDGANWFQELFFIRLPLLKPVFMFLTVLGIIGAFQAFESVYVLTAGGPARSTEIIVWSIWNQAFSRYNMGYAAAIALMLFAIIIGFTLLQMKLIYGKKEEDHA